MPAYTIWNTATECIRETGFRPDPENLPLQENEEILLDIELDGQFYKIDKNTKEPYLLITPKPISQVESEIVTAVQNKLDAFARDKGYENIMSACTYATDPNPEFAAEGQKAVNLRSQTWQTLYNILADVKSGGRTAPTGYEEIESELPILSWS